METAKHVAVTGMNGNEDIIITNVDNAKYNINKFNTDCTFWELKKTNILSSYNNICLHNMYIFFGIVSMT